MALCITVCGNRYNIDVPMHVATVISSAGGRCLLYLIGFSGKGLRLSAGQRDNSASLTAPIAYPIPGDPITLSFPSLLPVPSPSDRVAKLFENALKSTYSHKSRWSSQKYQCQT
jgi:hypothetical protein